MTKNQGKKITLFLVDGEPDGIKTLTLGGWNGIGLIFPRNKLKEVGTDSSSQKPGVYFLFGKESEDSPVISSYIGHANNIYDRLITHNNDKSKDFWYATVIFVSNDDTLTPAHAKYLESRCIELAHDVNHFGYDLKNGNDPAPASLPRTDIPMMEEFLTNASLLLAAVGYPILQKAETKSEMDKDNPVFYCQGKDTKGTARMTNEGFMLYKGSTFAAEHSKSVADRSKRVIEKLLAGEIIKKNENDYVLEQDYAFSSPSAAADLVLGYPANGWDVWRTVDGRTLNQIYRQQK